MSKTAQKFKLRKPKWLPKRRIQQDGDVTPRRSDACKMAPKKTLSKNFLCVKSLRRIKSGVFVKMHSCIDACKMASVKRCKTLASISTMVDGIYHCQNCYCVSLLSFCEKCRITFCFFKVKLGLAAYTKHWVTA